MDKQLKYSLDEITTEQALRLQNAEFKGMVIQALADIRNDIKEIKQEQSNQRLLQMLISGIVGGISGIFGGRIG